MLEYRPGLGCLESYNYFFNMYMFDQLSNSLRLDKVIVLKLQFYVQICKLWLSFCLGVQDVTVILSSLLPVICSYNDNDRSDFSMGLKVNKFSS